MKFNQQVVVLAGVSVVAGALLGSTVGKKVTQKYPKLAPVAPWISGVLIGAGTSALIAPKFVTKSEAASILASN